MKRATLALVAAFAAIVATAETSRTATENWTRNRIAEATNGLRRVDAEARPLPAYLHAYQFADAYPEDAAWYYQFADMGGACSSVRNGNDYARNFDLTYDERAEFVVEMIAGPGRLASVGVANVGTNLTEAAVTSGARSRFYKALPGATVDGINSEGVVCSINLVPTNGAPWETKGGRDLNAIGVVRFVLDTATSASNAAAAVASRCYIPDALKRKGYSAHFMLADERETWIVEDGTARPATGRAVLTNYRLFADDDPYGTGYERFNLLAAGGNITSAWFRAAYRRPFSRPTEFAAPGVGTHSDTDALLAWAEANIPHGAPESLTRGGNSWQTVHSSRFDISNRVMRVAVQERPNWYTFQPPASGGGKVKSVNGKDGEVVLNAADVHALPDTYEPPEAPVQSVNSKTGAVKLGAADVGAVGTNEYWSVKKGGEGGIGVKLGTAGIYSTFYVGYNDFGEIQNGAHWQYTSGGYEDFFSGSVLRMLTGSQFWWLTGAKPWLQTPTDFHIGGNAYGGGTPLPTWVDNRVAGVVPAWSRNATKPTYTPAEIGAATPQQVNAVDAKADAAQTAANAADAKADETRAVVVTLAGQINGSNVVFVVTNYLSGAYVLDAAKLQIRELRDGSYRTIYNSRDEIRLHLADFETNKLNVTRETLRQEIAAVLESMQHDAWGRRTSTGNPAPSNTIYTTEPNFVFGGGLEYERIAVGAGAIGVLADKGAPSYTAGDSGTFLFKDATGENYFGYSMTTGYAIGVPTDGIQVSGQRVTLTYNIVGSCPIVMWCPALFPGCAKDITGPGWYQLNDEEGNPIEGAPFECAVDMESTPEVATVYIDTGANPTGFFSAWTSVPGKSSFKTNMPVDLDAANGGGVVSSDGRTVIVPQPDGTWRPSNAN